jgi:hypothetical protein
MLIFLVNITITFFITNILFIWLISSKFIQSNITKNELSFQAYVAIFTSIGSFVWNIINRIPWIGQKTSSKLLYGSWNFIEWIIDPLNNLKNFLREDQLTITNIENDLIINHTNGNKVTWDSQLVFLTENYIVIKYLVITDDTHPQRQNWNGYLELTERIYNGVLWWKKPVGFTGEFYSLGFERYGRITIYRDNQKNWIKSARPGWFRN